jgi:GABA(A) receptor-associated protein
MTSVEESIAPRSFSSIRSKYPDRIPVIVTRAANSAVPELAKNKFLVPAELTVAQFQALLRKRLDLNPQQALFVFIDNSLPNAAGTMSLLYSQSNKDVEGILHLTYSGENTFG